MSVYRFYRLYKTVEIGRSELGQTDKRASFGAKHFRKYTIKSTLLYNKGRLLVRNDIIFSVSIYHKFFFCPQQSGVGKCTYMKSRADNIRCCILISNSAGGWHSIEECSGGWEIVGFFKSTAGTFGTCPILWNKVYIQLTHLEGIFIYFQFNC